MIESLEIRFLAVLLAGGLFVAYFFIAPATKTFLLEGQTIELAFNDQPFESDDPTLRKGRSLRLYYDRASMKLGKFDIVRIWEDRIELRWAISHPMSCTIEASGSGLCIGGNNGGNLVSSVRWQLVR